MDEYEYEWGHAAVTYPDWVGTAQLDQKLTGVKPARIVSDILA